MVNVRRKLLALLSAAALTACASSAAFAEGFGVYEWSAAGTAMGEAYMFGEEDPSVLAYNPAQITKLDGTAKGGVVIGISDQFRIPVKYIGLGEGMEDLQVFNRKEFVNSLFGE